MSKRRRSKPDASKAEAIRSYIEQIVEPTVKEFEQNQRSMRRAYLACVAAYHTADRAAYPKDPGNLKSQWRKECFAFVIVEMVALKFKHVVSDAEKAPTKEGYIPLSAAVFGRGTLNSAPLNTVAFNEGGVDLHNLYFMVRDAITFLRHKAGEKE